ncbi:MAG: SAM-dependent methyltransferase [Thermodesulfobacteriales bacterium]|nr:MAG: SAM-dependent methyltransferase [Thermodesulfobacteriales bacterium]
MAMKLKNVVPLGRSFDEYRLMFNLSKSDLGKRIIGVGDGPASFNAEMNEMGKTVVSVDPIYFFSAKDISHKFNKVFDNIIEQVKNTPGDWTWTYHMSPDDLRNHRIEALDRFTSDFEQGKKEGRYITGELPALQFQDGAFNIALCSHLLFLYSEHYDYNFHKASVYEMLRVSEEVRIFPLLDLMLRRSPYIGPLIKELERDGYKVKIKKVPYEIQRGGNEMMWVFKTSKNRMLPI